MEFNDVISLRTSIRKFTNEEIPLQNIKEMVISAGKAPSVNNSQPWKFVAVTNKEIMNKIAAAVHSRLYELLPNGISDSVTGIRSTVDRFSTFFIDAPVLIAVLNKPYEAIIDKALTSADLTHEDIDRLRNHPNIQTIGAAVENLLLSAVNLGYGGCWLTGPLVARKEIEQILNVEEPFTLAAMVALGKPASETAPKEKRSLDEIFELLD